MRHVHEPILAAADEARRRPASRRAVLRGTAALGGGALALTVPALRALQAAAQDVGDDEISVLNYALTLEHLENAFYRDGLAGFTGADLEAIGLQAGVYDYLVEIAGGFIVEAEVVTPAAFEETDAEEETEEAEGDEDDEGTPES